MTVKLSVISVSYLVELHPHPSLQRPSLSLMNDTVFAIKHVPHLKVNNQDSR